MALAGVAVGAEPELTPLTLTFTKDITAISSLPNDYTVVEKSVSLTGDTTTCLTKGSFKTDYLRPDTNVDSKGTSWTLNFSIGNNSGRDFVIDSIDIDAFTYTGGGGAQNNNRNFLFTVTAGETKITTKENLFIKGSEQNGTSEGTLTLNLDESLTIAADSTLKFTITVNQGAQVSYADGGGEARGSFVGIETVRFNAVPEPTTATLSLLALAGLAARRRRR
ncbi:MAG: PEP-CTERM sorting domain-containing protein [Akkermansia sp.]|nr:PEP-CTERM sorting domain-containing protein [Akkermansia sp.]